MGRTKSDIYDTSVSLYESGMSIKECSDTFGISRQAMHKILIRRGCNFRSRMHITSRGYESLSNKKKPSFERLFRKYQIFDGLKFTLRNNGYYAKTTGDRVLMHRYVWEKSKYAIPDGWDIHHINNDKSDNRIENLECLPKAEHTRKYSPSNNQFTKRRMLDSHRTF